MTPRIVLLSCIGRVIFVPLFLLCTSPSPTYPILTGPAWPIIFTVAFGLTNGYLGCLPMVAHSKYVTEHKHKELAGKKGHLIWGTVSSKNALFGSAVSRFSIFNIFCRLESSSIKWFLCIKIILCGVMRHRILNKMYILMQVLLFLCPGNFEKAAL